MARGAGLDRRSWPATSRRWRRPRTRLGEGGKKFVVTAVKGELPTTDDSPKYDRPSIDGEGPRLGEGQRGRPRPASSTPGDEVGAAARPHQLLRRAGRPGRRHRHRSARRPGEFEVEDTQRLGDARPARRPRRSTATIEVGQTATLHGRRRPRIDIMRNHTATHLLNLGAARGARRARRAEGLARRCREDALRLHATTSR